MSSITAASIKYGESFVTKVGGVLFTATNIEVPATTEDYVEGGVELKPEKLGLTVGLISIPPSEGVGETASTTALPGAIWCNPVLALAKASNEEGKQVAEGVIAQVTLVKGKPFLRVYAQETAGIGKFQIEPKTSTEQDLPLFMTTVFAFGR